MISIIFARILRMDRIDKKIIAELQQNGRISLTELSEKIGISLSPCQRRVKALEEQKIISHYQAHIDPIKVGLNFTAILFITLKDCNHQSVTAFEQAVVEIAEITQAQRLFGDPDYMLHIVTKDLASYQQLYDRRLSSLPYVARLSSTLVMKEVLSNRCLPL
ncbi:Lrp/AsnC family transcriptional regulator [Volucribacter amazonae]|nr:Lrp/AsnC family transcriptional regulator [Volucribacter amazonae]